MRLFSIETSSASGASGQIWQYFYFRLLGEALGFAFVCARVKFAHFDLNHLLRLPGTVHDTTSRAIDDGFEPISFSQASDCLDDPDRLRGKERIRIVFDDNYWRRSRAFQARITKHLESNGDAQSRALAILDAMRESARIPNPLTATDPYTIVVHVRLGDQFGFKLKPCRSGSAPCLDEQSCAQLLGYTGNLLETINRRRATGPASSRIVLFSDGLWCVADHDGKRLDDPLLVTSLNARYLSDLASAVDESFIDYRPSYGELAVRYFAHCDLILRGVGGFAPAVFLIYNRKPNSTLASLDGLDKAPDGFLPRLIERSRIVISPTS